ncbi:MAG: hypothetical protein DRP47_01275 [Candidatus Zixiibacteriota bacterium]|nr:MAG: hypothetical protein DRP47_01275 [candidate division Zixibacteria bacterium]
MKKEANMRTWIFCAFVLALILPAIPVLAENSITIDSVATFTNQTGKVPVNFTNDIELAGVELTVWWNSPEIQIDSFSFIDGRVDYTTLKGTYVMGDTVTVYALPFSGEPLIGIGTGLFGHLHFSYPLEINPQVVTIDSVTVIVPPDVDYGTRFMEPSKGYFTPDFNKGYLDIQQAFGCCSGIRGNVDNQGDDEPNIADLTYLVSFLFQGGPPPDCPEEADMNADGDPEANVADLTYLIAFLFLGGPDPLPCNP